MEKFSVKTTRRCEMVDITGSVRKIVAAAKANAGICVLFCPHTTAGLTINENADPSVKSDMLRMFEELIPADRRYAHAEGNSDSHIKSSLFGASLTLCIAQSQLALGTWQGIFLCESDGPRVREVWVTVVKG